MKIQVINYDRETAVVGYIKEGKTVDLSKHEDYCMGKKSTFWRIDHNGRTVDSIIRTKAEAVKSAKAYIKKTYGGEN